MKEHDGHQHLASFASHHHFRYVWSCTAGSLLAILLVKLGLTGYVFCLLTGNFVSFWEIHALSDIVVVSLG